MKSKKTNFYAPLLDRFRDYFINSPRHGMPRPYSPKTTKALDVLFAEIRSISPYYENGVRKLFFQIDRGPMEEYGDYDELLAAGVVESREEFEEMWKQEYPEKTQWFAFSFIEDETNGYRGVWMDSQLIMEAMPDVPVPPDQTDFSEFVLWLAEKVRECIPDIKSGEYNRKVRCELSVEQRIGTISRKAYWDLFPEKKAEYFSELSPTDRNAFLKLMENYREGLLPDNLITDMTSGLFFRCCAMGYAANHYDGSDTLSPKDLYKKHADGRDEGLTRIDENSPEAFSDWHTHRPDTSGHPWEVCKGGNSTHISLYVCKADAGFYFVVSGSSWICSIETIKFYLALHRAGMPVMIDDGKLLADRIQGVAKIGIVPKGVIPCYCSGYFPGEKILDFMNLPTEKQAEFASRCVWRDEPELTIILDQ